MEGAAECDRIHRNRCHKTIEPSAPEQEPITATQEHQDRRGGAECFSSRGGVAQSQRATIGLWCVCEHGVTRAPPPLFQSTSVCLCVHTHTRCAFIHFVCACVCAVTHICVSTCTLTFLRLHVYVTLEWLLQLQRMGVYLVDSAEGLNGPGRW